jgi:hypothetical protein
MANLVADLKNNAKWRVQDALTYRSLLFGQYLDAISGKNDIHISKKALLEPTRLFITDADDEPAWKIPGVIKGH